MAVKIAIVPSGNLDLANAKGTVEGDPVFYGNGRDACTIALIMVKDGDTVVRQGVVRLSGTDLKLSIVDRTAPTPSKFEQKKKKKEDKPK